MVLAVASGSTPQISTSSLVCTDAFLAALSITGTLGAASSEGLPVSGFVGIGTTQVAWYGAFADLNEDGTYDVLAGNGSAASGLPGTDGYSGSTFTVNATQVAP